MNKSFFPANPHNMKQYNFGMRLCAFCLLIISFCVTVKAQHAFHVYRHDGNVNSFFYADCDSITYARVPSETDSPTVEFVQLIHTADSVFRIPVNEIDSVSFYKPETVFQPDVIYLEESLASYLTGCDGLVLTFNENIPFSLLPKVGDKLVTLEMENLFPTGFVGKVLSVNKVKGKYQIECELPSLTDIFESYYYDGTFEMQTSDEGLDNDRIMSRGYEIWPPRSEQFTIPPVDVHLTVKDLELKSGPYKEEYSQTIGCGVTSKMYARVSLIVNDGIHLNLTMTGEHALTPYFKASMEGKAKLKKGPKREVPIPYTGKLLNLYFETGVFVELAGSISGSCEQTHYVNSALHLEYHSNSVSNIPNQIKFVHKGKDDPILSFAGDVSIKMGVCLEFGISVLTKELAKAGIEGEFGLKGDINMGLDATKLGIMSPPITTLYDRLKDVNQLTATPYVGCSFIAEASKGPLEIGGSVGKVYEFLSPMSFGVIPLFEDMNVNVNAKTGSISTTANISNVCFGQRRVGFAMYQDNKLVDVAWYSVPYDGIHPLQISHTFTNVALGKKYVIYPIVELFRDIELLATPCSEAELKVNVQTGGSSNISTQSATLSGIVEGINSTIPCEYGISYRKEGTLEWVDAPSSEKGGGTFSCRISGLISNTGYSYRAYLRVNGQVCYGTIRSFRTEKEAAAYGVTTEGISNLTSSSVLLAGIVQGIEESTPCEYGIAYKDRNSRNWTEIPANGYNSNGYFICNVVGLSPNTEYDYRAYLHVDGKDFWGTTRYFITEGTDLDPSVLTVLQDFYKSANGSGWYNHTNWLEDSELLWWYGFSPSSEKEELYDLRLDNNNLSGNVMLRNSNFIASMSLENNPIQSLTLERCEGLSELTLPGQGETLSINSCGRKSGVSNSSPEFLTIDTRENGNIGHIDISRSTYSKVNIGGYLSDRNISVDKLDYTGADQNFRGYLEGGLNTAIGQLNLSHVYDEFTVSYNEIETLNISEVYSSRNNNMIGRWDIGYTHRNGHIKNVNVDQGDKLPFSISFYQHVDIANIRNMNQPTSGVSAGHIFFRFEEGVNEINIDNLQLQSTMFSIWTPTPIIINIANSSFLLSSYSDTADNVFNFINCDVSTDVGGGITKRLHNLTFKGTKSQLQEHLKINGY